jgi:hypothetical protein
MGIFAALKFKNFAKRVFNGVADSFPVVATIKKNIEADHKGNGDGFGSIDWVRLIVNIGCVAATLYITINVVKGNITIETAKELLNLVK